MKDTTRLRSEVEALGRLIDTIVDRLDAVGLRPTLEEHGIIVEGTLVETLQNDREMAIGNRIEITSNQRNNE